MITTNRITTIKVQFYETILCFSCIMFLFASLAHSAEVFFSQDQRCTIVLSGQIEMGDAQRVAAAIQGANSSPTVCLDSQGGSFLGGLELSRLFMSEGVSTYLRRTDECFSACAIAFLGGSSWGDFRHTSRVVEPGGVLGFHAPFLIPPQGTYDHHTVAEAARTTVVVIRELLEHRVSLKISDSFILNFLLDTSPETRRIETIEDLAHSGSELATYFTIDVPEVHDLRRACMLAFSVYQSHFVDPITSWEPVFELEESELSNLLPAYSVEIEGANWTTVSMQHEWGTPWQTSSCAFREERDHIGYFPLILWNNGVGEAPNMERGIRSLRISIPDWYFLGSDFLLADL